MPLQTNNILQLRSGLLLWLEVRNEATYTLCVRIIHVMPRMSLSLSLSNHACTAPNRVRIHRQLSHNTKHHHDAYWRVTPSGSGSRRITAPPPWACRPGAARRQGESLWRRAAPGPARRQGPGDNRRIF